MFFVLRRLAIERRSGSDVHPEAFVSQPYGIQVVDPITMFQTVLPHSIIVVAIRMEKFTVATENVSLKRPFI